MSFSNAAQHRLRKRQIDSAIHETIEDLARNRRAVDSFVELVNDVRSKSDLLTPMILNGPVGFGNLRPFLRGLQNLSLVRSRWKSNSSDWKPSDDTLQRQFVSLIDHLFATHAVPRFMYAIWFDEPSAKSDWHQTLFFHLAGGNNIRGAKLPFPLTKPMARHFSIAPDHFSIDQALQWARSGSKSEDSKRLFPAATSKRRKKLAIGKRHRACTRSWSPVAINNFRWLEPSETPWHHRCWTIRQLLTRDELSAEGLEMQHCVGAYGRECAAGDTSIWSMMVHGTISSKHALTIEIDPFQKQIIQATGLRNRAPRAHELRVLSEWAKSESLKIARWVR